MMALAIVAMVVSRPGAISWRPGSAWRSKGSRWEMRSSSKKGAVKVSNIAGGPVLLLLVACRLMRNQWRRGSMDSITLSIVKASVKI